MPKYFEEYTCGCTSDTVEEDELLGYCATHGADRRYKHPEGGIAPEAAAKLADALQGRSSPGNAPFGLDFRSNRNR